MNQPAAAQESSWKQAFSWLQKGTWSVLDQGLFAGSNFVLNIMLARWLSPEGYGAFTVAYTVFLLLATLHAGLLIQPMLVYGPSQYDSVLPSYLRLLVRGHAVFSVALGIVTGLIGLGFWLGGSDQLASALFVLAGAQAFVLLMWLVRRACYVRTRPALAASGGAFYLVIMLGGAYALYQTALLSVATALALMSIASLVAACWILVRLGVFSLAHGGAAPSSTKSPSLRKSVLARHWAYGRWEAATNMLNFFPGQVFYFILPFLGGLEASGAMRALVNLTLPAAHASSALALLLVPVFVRARRAGRLRRFAIGSAWLIGLGLVGYWALLGAFAEPLVAWFYQGQYVEYAPLLWIAGVLPVFQGLLAVFSAGLKALERPDSVFWANVASTALTFTVGLALVISLDIMGAFLSNAAALGVALAVAAWLLFAKGSALGTGAARQEPADAADAGHKDGASAEAEAPGKPGGRQQQERETSPAAPEAAPGNASGSS